MKPALLLCCLALLALGCDACTNHTPPASTPAPPDPDTVMTIIAEGVGIAGVAMQDNATTWGECVAGVVMESFGAYTRDVAIPIKQDVESGTCQGSAGGVTIDPGPCIGLSGTPELPDGQALAREEIEKYLDLSLPMFSGLAAAGALSADDQGTCVALTLLSNLLNPAGDLVAAILTIVETPGTPFTTPEVSWDCSGCPSPS